MAANKSGKTKRKELSPRQMKLIKARAEGKTYAQAAVAAGYPEKNARQSGFQAMQQIRGRIPDLMGNHG
jgi:DNA-directed RNA polymerase specialized sigma24 family protein